MEIRRDVPLRDYTTLRVGGPAKYFVEVGSLEELARALEFAKTNDLPVFILGGGSNLLVSDVGFEGLVIRPLLRGRHLVGQDDRFVFLEVGAGEVLDECIAWTVQKGWWGLENLSFIPGLVGALVIQNVNAYGAKAEQVVDSVRVWDQADEVVREFTNAECLFRYRGSVFNKEEKNRHIVLSVRLRLLKNGEPTLGYADIAKYFSGKEITSPTISEMREVVIHIRKGKGFDPEKNWSAGSFFSNLMLTSEESKLLEDKIRANYGDKLADKYEVLVSKFYEEGEKDPELGTGKIKIPTGFILDQVLGLKGFELGGAKISNMHAQTFINTGAATAKDIYALYQYVATLAREKLGLTLVHEPIFVGFD